MGNFSGVFFEAVSSNGLLRTSTFRIIQDGPDYKEGLVKDSNFIVQTRMLAFPFGWVFLSFDFNYRCWRSSASVQKRKFWNFRQNASMNCWLCACKHRWQLLHTYDAVQPTVQSQCNSLTALSFLLCFQASFSKKLAPSRLYWTNLNKRHYRKVSWKRVFGPIQLFCFASR